VIIFSQIGQVAKNRAIYFTIRNFFFFFYYEQIIRRSAASLAVKTPRFHIYSFEYAAAISASECLSDFSPHMAADQIADKQNVCRPN